MTTPRTPPPLPALRATVFALVGTVLGLCAHQLSAGGPTPWRQSGAAAAVLLAMGLVGARRPRSLLSVTAACGAAQVGLHLWLGCSHAHVLAHVHEHTAAGCRPPPYDSQAMAAGHLAAALLVAVLLHRADAACWSLAQGLTTTIATIRTLLTIALHRPAPTAFANPAPVRPKPPRARLRGTVLTDVVVRRGPPQAGPLRTNRPCWDGP